MCRLGGQEIFYATGPDRATAPGVYYLTDTRSRHTIYEQVYVRWCAYGVWILGKKYSRSIWKILNISVDYPDNLFYRTYMGGACLGAYYLLKEMPPGTDAFDPANIMVFSPGIATGARGPGLARTHGHHKISVVRRDW